MPVAANDDRKTSRDFFSDTQMNELNALVIPYCQNGLITGFEYKKGHDSSAFIVKDERMGRNNVVFCVTIRAPEGELPTYAANIGRAKINAETINFSEVLRTARGALQVIFPDMPAAKPRFSIV